MQINILRYFVIIPFTFIEFVYALLFSRIQAIVRPRHNETAPVPLENPRMTLADLVPLIQTSSLTPTQKRDQISAVRRVARLLRADAAQVAADPAALRRRLDGIAPEALGLTRASYSNLRSLLGKALEHARVVAPGRRTTPISPAWQAMLGLADGTRRIRLSPLVRALSAQGVEPGDVTLEHLEAYGRMIREDRLRRQPEKAWDMLIWTWNACLREIPGWPAVAVPRADGRESYILPWSAFPVSLKADVDAFLRRQSGKDLSEDGPSRPLRPSSLKTRERQLRLAASALAARGVDPAELILIADLLTLERYKEILSFFLDRRDGQTSVQVGQIAGFLKSVAEHWAKTPDLDLAKMKRLVARLSINRRSLTAKNRERLRPLDDPAIVQRFLALPQTIRDSVEKDRRPARLKAIAAQMAAAIAILQFAPIRLGNLVALDMRRHLIERNGRVYLVIAGHEVKNGEPVDFELPASAVDVIKWYVLRYRPHLLRGRTDALFPGEGDGPKSIGALGTQISREVFNRVGLKFHPHLFRHAAGKIFLDQNPGQYEIVRRVLGHRSIATTTAIYTGAETRAAGAHFAAVVESLRQKPGARSGGKA
jgi:integrase